MTIKYRFFVVVCVAIAIFLIGNIAQKPSAAQGAPALKMAVQQPGELAQHGSDGEARTSTGSILSASFEPFSGVELIETSEPFITTTPAAPVIPLTGGCALTFDEGFEAEVVALINAERARYNLPALQESSALAGSSQSHSNDMACYQFFSHTGSDGATVWERIESFGYAYTYAGENVGGGFATPKALVAAWMSSPGHRANILSERFTHVGVGYAYTEKGAYHTYWTADFAAP